MDYPIFAGHSITIETPRLLLRPLEKADIEIALQYYQDPDLKFAM